MLYEIPTDQQQRGLTHFRVDRMIHEPDGMLHLFGTYGEEDADGNFQPFDPMRNEKVVLDVRAFREKGAIADTAPTTGLEVAEQFLSEALDAADEQKAWFVG